MRDETDMIAELLAKALPEALAAAERRFALRLQAEMQASKSAELTMAERKVEKTKAQLDEAERSRAQADDRARRRGGVAIGTSVSSLVMLVVLIFAVKFLRGLIGQDIEEATSSVFEERTAAIEERVAATDDRIDNLEHTIDNVNDDTDDLKRSMVRVLERLPAPDDDERPAKKTKARQR